MKYLFLIFFLFLFSCKTSYIIEIPDDQDLLDKKLATEFEVGDESNFLDMIFKKKTKIALLLPLTGKYSNIGNELLNSAHLSLQENDNKKKN